MRDARVAAGGKPSLGMRHASSFLWPGRRGSHIHPHNIGAAIGHFDCERGGTLRGGAAARVVMALHMDGLTEIVAAPRADTARLRGLAMRGVGDLADREGLGQRMAWGAALATQCLGEGAGSHDKAREVLD